MDIKPFEDSSPLLNDLPALRKRLRVDGYLFLKGMFPKDRLGRTLDAMLAEVAASGWLRVDTDPKERFANESKACAEPAAAFREVYDKVFALEAFHALPHADQAMDIMRHILDDDNVLIHPRKIARIIFPVEDNKPDYSTPAHQDFWALQGSPETYTVWVPLHDCSFEEGSLMVAKGSHRHGVYGYRLSLGAGGVEIEDPLEGAWHGGDFEAGDAIVFPTLLVHRAAQNRTNRLRFSVDFRFQRYSDEICSACIDLAGTPYSWKDLYENWEDSALKFYWTKSDLKTVPYDNKYYDRRDQLALTEGAKGNPAAISALQRLVKQHPDRNIRKRAANLVASLSGDTV